MTLVGALEIVTMEPAHALAIRRQDSQRLQLGIVADFDADDAERIAAAPGECWAAVEGDRVVAVFGLIEVFPRRQATAWAVLSSDIGRHHLAITRFCAERIAQSVYRRIEAIVECEDVEPWIGRFPDIDQGELIEALMQSDLRTPGVRWALACGLKPAAVLRCYGQASETHMLFERIA
jgi:hypothetical protein